MKIKTYSDSLQLASELNAEGFNQLADKVIDAIAVHNMGQMTDEDYNLIINRGENTLMTERVRNLVELALVKIARTRA